jgi:hypothetical protein
MQCMVFNYAYIYVGVVDGSGIYDILYCTVLYCRVYQSVRCNKIHTYFRGSFWKTKNRYSEPKSIAFVTLTRAVWSLRMVWFEALRTVQGGKDMAVQN